MFNGKVPYFIKYSAHFFYIENYAEIFPADYSCMRIILDKIWYFCVTIGYRDEQQDSSTLALAALSNVMQIEFILFAINYQLQIHATGQ